jgi:hypothetical protein
MVFLLTVCSFPGNKESERILLKWNATARVHADVKLAIGFEIGLS